MKTTSAILAGIVGLALHASVAQADVITWNGTGDGASWSDDANWVGGVEPISGADSVVIDGSFTVNYDVVAAQNFSDLDLFNGAQLNMTTGALELPGAVNVSVGNITGASVLNFSGGTHDFSTRLGLAAGSTIRVTGNDATITLGQTAAMFGDFDFRFDSDGVSSLDFLSYVQGLDRNDVTVNGSLYTGGSGEFTLINANGLNALISNISVSGFSAAAYTTEVFQDQTADRVYLTVTAIPEPSSLALLGPFHALSRRSSLALLGLGIGALLLRRLNA